MIKKKLLWLVPILLIFAIIPIAEAAVTLQPNSTARDILYYDRSIDRLYAVIDQIELPYLYDWYGDIYYNGVLNKSIPKSYLRWTFDFNDQKRVYDTSVVALSKNLETNKIFFDGMVVYIPFDQYDTGYFYDWSTYGLTNHSATYDNTRGLFIEPECHVGACVLLNSTLNPYVNITANATSENLHNFTVSAWVKFTGTSTRFPKIVYHVNNTPRYYWEFYFLNANDSYCGSQGAQLAYYGDSTGSSMTYYSDCINIRDGNFHHVALTVNSSYDQRKAKMFYDGTEVTYNYTQAGGGQFTNRLHSYFSVGAEQPNYDDKFPGYIDEFMIFNRTLSDTEVRDLSRVPSCIKGYCYNFRNNTNDYIRRGNDAIYVFAGRNFSISAWVYPFFENAGERKIVNKGWAGNGAWALTLDDNREFRFRVKDNSGNTYSSTYYGVGHPFRWYHVVGVWRNDSDGLNISVYVNGVQGETASALTTKSYLYSTGALEVSASGITQFIGSIDDVIFYNKSLTGDEINDIYYSQLHNNFSVGNLMNGSYMVNITYRNSTATNTFLNTTYIFNFAYYNFSIDTCPSGTYNALNISLYNEDTLTLPMIGNIDISLVYWLDNEIANISEPKNFSANYTNVKSIGLCISTNDTYYIDAYIRNSVNNGFTHRHYMVNSSINAVQQNVSLYNVNDTTGYSDLRGIARNDETYAYYPNAIVTMQRRYLYLPPSLQWVTVQMDESDQFGQIYFDIIEKTQDYRFIFEDRNELVVLSNTGSMKFACIDGICDLVYLIPPVGSLVVGSEFFVNISYDNATNIVSINWSDITELVENVRVLVTMESAASTTVICDNTYPLSQNSSTCDVSGYAGAIAIRVYTSASPEIPYIIDWLDLGVDSLADALKAAGLTEEGAFWSGASLFVAGGAGAAIGSPIVAIGLGVVMFLVLLWLGISPILTIGMLTAVIVIAVLISLRGSRG